MRTFFARLPSTSTKSSKAPSPPICRSSMTSWKRVGWMTDLMAGQVQVVFNPVPESMEFIRAGKLRPLAVTTATRSEVLSDVPTVGDFVPGYEASALQGIGAPKETPAEIVDKLNREINAGLVDPKLKARFADLGAAVFPGSSSDFAKFIATETEKWAKVIKFSGAKAD